jgi:CRISPR-associated endonuclease Csn1
VSVVRITFKIMIRNLQNTYRIGVDVGDRSVGLAAIAYDAAGMPVEVLATVSHIHDGGMDPDTGKSPLSRLATSGVARRTRRLIRNRRRRLAVLDEVLAEHGFPVPTAEIAQTYDAWFARATLSEKFVKFEDERLRLVSLAVRHIARHRGWRNPWWSYERLAEEPSPSEHLTVLLRQAEERFGQSVGTWSTLGQVAMTTVGRDVALRPRTSSRPGMLARREIGPVISHQIQQQDSLFELLAILAVQQVARDAIEAISRAVFVQNKPHVPVDRVGRDSLPGMRYLPRVALGVLEFQEFRIRAAVANLRVKGAKSTTSPLTDEEHDLVVSRLMAWRETERPRWLDVAEWLDISVRNLVRPALDDGGTSVAPCDRSSRAIEAVFKPSTQVGRWWASASLQERAELVAVVADSTTSTGEMSDRVSRFAEEWSTDTMEKLDRLSLESGRAAYSRESLAQMLVPMREQRVNLHDARKSVFDVDDSWQPPGPTFDDVIEHPTVSRVNVLVRRFVSTAVLKWGLPETVVVEHVRSSFMGPAARAEFEYELKSNTKRRAAVTGELITQGVERPTDRDRRRYECMQRQNSVCLYCGATISMATSELDHIIADSQGGSNRRDNLVAVCRLCNSEKGKLPFVSFVKKASRPGIDLDEARGRLRAWNRAGMTVVQFKRFIADVSRRLGLAEDPDESEDRSIESTAYAAREMRARIGSYLASEAQRRGIPDTPSVRVYSGSVTAEARRAGHVHERLNLREQKTKTRLDRRHHAIDAAVLTSIGDGIAITLRTRSQKMRANRMTGKEPGWKDYDGATAGEKAGFHAWETRIAALAGLLVTEVANDRIAVVRPLRLSPRVGLVHKATVEPLHRKYLNDAFSVKEILRVCDRQLFERLTNLADPKHGLPADPARAKALALPPDCQVDLYPSNSAYIRVRGGAAALGGSVQHARVYAWQVRDGHVYGIVRMYTGEFPKIGLAGDGIDVMTAPLPAWSQTMRCAHPTVRAKITSGEARQIGWITLKDEIEIDVASLAVGETAMAQFLEVAPESRWFVTGFFSSHELSVAPAYLAAEGIGDDTPEAISSVLTANRIRMSVNLLLNASDGGIIRRTVLGRPRWEAGGLPNSWKPREKAEEAFR